MVTTSIYNVSVMIVAFNEASTLPTLIQDIDVNLQGFGQSEIVVCDDGSTDETAAVVEAVTTLSNLRIVRHETNLGYAAATATALKSALGRRIVIVDGDGQHDGEQVRTMLTVLHGREIDVLFPTRISRSEPLIRLLASKFVTCLAKTMLHFPNNDVNGGIKGFSRVAADSLDPQHRVNLVNPELWAQVRRLGLSFDFVSVRQLPRLDGTASRVAKKPVRTIVALLKYFWKLRRELRA